MKPIVKIKGFSKEVWERTDYYCFTCGEQAIWEALHRNYDFSESGTLYVCIECGQAFKGYDVGFYGREDLQQLRDTIATAST